MADYDDILNKSWDELPVVRALPDGDYLVKARGGKYNPANDKVSARVNFGYEVVEPVSIFDEDLAAEFEGYDYSENDIFYSVWVDKAKDWAAIGRHLETHGVEKTGTIQDGLKAIRGQMAVATVGTRSYVRNGEEVVENTLSNFRPVDA